MQILSDAALNNRCRWRNQVLAVQKLMPHAIVLILSNCSNVNRSTKLRRANQSARFFESFNAMREIQYQPCEAQFKLGNLLFLNSARIKSMARSSERV